MTATIALSTEKLTETLKILHDPTRLLLMKLLMEKTYCVCELVGMFEVSQPAISQHLRKYKKQVLYAKKSADNGGTIALMRLVSSVIWWSKSSGSWMKMMSSS